MSPTRTTRGEASIVRGMNRIHPTAIVEPTVILGDGNTIGPYTVILGNCVVGDNNWFGPHVVVGTPSQMRKEFHPATWGGDESKSSIVIGSRNVVREFTTIQLGTHNTTTIGDDCYFMTQAHIPHDAVIEDEVTLSNSVQIGGHTIVQSGANIGLGAVVHQRIVVGSRSMVGMGSVVTKHVPPFAMFFGSPGRTRGGNAIGMQRAGVSPKLIDDIVEALTQNDLERLRVLAPEQFSRFSSAAQQQGE